jgi:O-antigen ligase
VATLAAVVEKKGQRAASGSPLAFNALLLFTFIYYTRPEDIVPGLAIIPFEKIIGAVALISLISTLASGRVKRKLPLEFKLLLLLFVHLAISIPFAYWRGGAFATVFERFYKDIIVALLVTFIVENLSQLRKLLWVQAASLVATTLASLLLHRTQGGRLIGALGGTFENPNDLAINIAINWPLCLGFLLLARGALKKGAWTIGILAMFVAVVLTYSRSGLVALVVAVAFSLWKFGIAGKRYYLIGASFVLSMVALGGVLATPNYVARVESIFKGNVEGSLDKGSWEARKEILELSVHEFIHNPVFGIGAGNFGAATRTWKVTHNTYTEFAAEGGFPAILLFIVILYLAFRNLKRIRALPYYRDHPDVQILADAMWASMAAFVVGAFFASYEYELFSYFMMAYTSVLYRFCAENSAQVGVIEKPPVPQAFQRLYGPKESWKR